MKKSFCEVAVNFPRLNSTLTYKSPLSLNLKEGDLVQVPLGKRTELGCVVSFVSEKDVDRSIEYKEVMALDKEHFRLSENELKLFKWVSSYYLYSYGKLIFDSLPPYLKKVKNPSFIEGKNNLEQLALNENQKKILEKFDIKDKGFSQNLVHGVTGSGKSIVFLEMIKKKIKAGLSVHFLVPEINLTPQFISFFSEFLGCKIYCYHSSIKNSERFNLWREVKELKEPILIIGVRSSVFLPVSNLGLIIVDEEHDPSFKQDDRCRFNARDVAIKKAQMLGIPIVMGSATPTVENYHRFKNNENLNYFELKDRYNDSKLPNIFIENNAEEKSETWPLNKDVFEKLQNVVKEGGQAIVFVNKLGFSKYIQCSSCYHNFECPNCAVNLTYYKSRSSLECHCCEYKENVPRECPACGCVDLFHQGFGTEQVLNKLGELIPDVSVARFDRDELKKIDQVEKTLQDFQEGKIKVLVGTQMISKGHNLRNVRMVAILGVDSYLHSPDFRASERVFQLITQISGRAGRFGEDADVHIQSDLNPSFFKEIQSHSFSKFYEDEIEVRERLDLPPFYKMAQLSFEGKTYSEAKKFSEETYHLLTAIKEKNHLQFQLNRPYPSAISKRKNKFFWNLSLSFNNFSQVGNLLHQVFLKEKSKNIQKCTVDVDPYHLS